MVIWQEGEGDFVAFFVVNNTTVIGKHLIMDPVFLFKYGGFDG